MNAVGHAHVQEQAAKYHAPVTEPAARGPSLVARRVARHAAERKAAERLTTERKASLATERQAVAAIAATELQAAAAIAARERNVAAAIAAAERKAVEAEARVEAALRRAVEAERQVSALAEREADAKRARAEPAPQAAPAGVVFLFFLFCLCFLLPVCEVRAKPYHTQCIFFVHRVIWRRSSQSTSTADGFTRPSSCPWPREG